MESSVATVLLVAVLAANLPFFMPRIAGVIKVESKHVGWRLLELVVLFFLVGLLAHFLEGRQMPVHSQNWQFYATTASLFLVFAFPGFVYRYFWKKRRH